MAGLQIRWRTLGRAAAIAAAAIAGIISLPSLLGGGRPPPVPADVGLAPVPSDAAPVAAPGAARDLAPAPPKPEARDRPTLAAQGRSRHGHRRRRHGRREPSHSHTRHSRPSHGQSSQAAPAPPLTAQPSASPTPVSPYVQPPSSGEFRIER